MTEMNRRRFLMHSLAGGAALGLQGLIVRGSRADSPGVARAGEGGYGPLRPTRSLNTGETLLALPEGFRYTVLGKEGEKMADGHPTPGKHDGMAAFTVDGKIRLVRNHELKSVGAGNRVIGDPKRTYDANAPGGTTTLVIDPITREVTRDFVSLSGTAVNCAGGPTPWGTWISCEEITQRQGQGKDTLGNLIGGYGKNHGYCFEVPVRADSEVEARPLKAMGRFVHEAVAVDPRTDIVYETEDRGSAGFYRFLPKERRKLSAGGKLQMLAVRDRPGYDTRKGQTVGEPMLVTWVDIDEPDPDHADKDDLAVYKQGIAKGGATFARLEGCWYGNGQIYMTATNGGDKDLGQVWQYRPLGRNSGQLTLLFESVDPKVLRSPDNLCVSPRGGLVLCEDTSNEVFVRGLTPDGRIFDLVQNLYGDPNDKGVRKELAGSTFSRDGKTLFFNTQTPGATFALWGPWERGSL
ncbi:MAG: PhoX family protein [Armatimonadetes bacterium]|nr:PhoX family protein [Armatimonadota bacterium]